MLLLLLGCIVATPEVGVIRPLEDGVELYTEDGRHYPLTLNADAAALAWLHDCVVEVDGPRLGGRIQVRTWQVRDAGDGSAGYLGLLRAYGGRLTIDDRNSGSTIVLEDATSGALRPYVGQEVLVLGHVIGGNLVAPMAWRVLGPEGEATAP